MESKTTIALVVVFILSVAVSLAGTGLIRTQDSQTPPAGPDIAAASQDAIKAELADLKDRVAALKKKVEELEKLRIPVYSASREKAPASAESPAEAGVNKLPNAAELEELVRTKAIEALKEEREAREAEQQAEREERRVRRTEEMEKRMTEMQSEQVKKLSEELDLSSGQEEDITAAMEKRREQIMKFFSSRRSRSDRGEEGEQEIKGPHEIQKEYQDTIDQILTEEQLKVYQDKKLGGFGMPFGRGMGGGMGGGRGGGGR